MQYTVPTSQMRVSRDPGDVLITHSLGSCIGVACYDPEARIGGLAHFMLAQADTHPLLAIHHPAMFVDTGISRLLEVITDWGGAAERLRIFAAGAANLLDAYAPFRVGDRNREALEATLRQHGLALSGMDLGGTAARSLGLNIRDGRVTVRSRGNEYALT